MECPNCSYKDEWWDDDYETLNYGEEGRFYELPSQLKQGHGWGANYYNLYGCPKCKHLFMDK